MTLLHPWLALIALLVVAMVVGPRLRRRRLSVVQLLLLVGALGLILSLAGPTLDHAAPGRVVVMVDLSPSTRSATFRDRPALFARIGQLLGSTTFDVYAFASDARPLPDGQSLSDVPVDVTTFTPPPGADAVVVFSDGRFVLPTSGAATYPVLDPALSRTSDTSVRRLESRDGGRQLAVTFHNSTDDARRATLTHVKPPAGATVTRGELVVTRDLLPAPGVAGARLSPKDAWPENDALDLAVAPAPASQRWWVTQNPSSAPPGFRAIDPRQLDTSPAAWLAPSVVALDDVAPSALSAPALRALSSYVTDLGGSLLILGPGRSLGPGGLTGTPLDALSPLSFTAPTPRANWVVLVDASGSMAEVVGGKSRWDQAVRATNELIRTLPPGDGLSVGSFNQGLRWWTTGRSVGQTIEGKIDLPPTDVRPGGPTNLDAVLTQLATEPAGTLQAELLVVTDARATFTNAGALASRLTARGVRASALLVDDTQGAASDLTDLCTRTGGNVLSAGANVDWSRQMQELARATQRDAIESTPLDLRWTGATGATLGPRKIDSWRQSWVKDRATTLAEATGAPDGGVQFPVARWQAGAGTVVGTAFAPTRAEVVALADGSAMTPRDPRLRVTWDTGETLRVGVRASDSAGFLNGLALSVDVRDADDLSIVTTRAALEQTAPGEYEIELPAPRRSSLVTLRLNGTTVVDRTSVAGRYAPEFDAVGTDLAALQRLASRTGGRVIEPTDTLPIDFHWPRRATSLAPALATISVALLLGAVVAWRVRS